MLKQILSICPLVFVFACQSEDTIETSIVGFDISRRHDSVAYAVSSNSGVSIFKAALDESNTSLILKGTKEASYFSPSFSPDGYKLTVVRRSLLNLYEQTVLIVDLKGNILDSMNVRDGMITEAKFSNDGQEVIFCRAKKFENYSPIVPSAPHGMDIFSLNLLRKSIVKITDLNAYSLENLEVLGNDTLMFDMMGDSSGLFLLRKSSGRFSAATPINNPRGDSTCYYSPVYCSKSHTLVFAAPYQIYSMSLRERVAHLIYDGRGKSHMYWIRISAKDCRVYFTHSSYYLQVFSVAIDGSDLRTVELDVR